jgi:membrane dipeptidase
MSQPRAFGQATTRRRFLSEIATYGAAVAFSGLSPSAQQITWNDYDRIVVIDGLSFLDERGTPSRADLPVHVLQAIRASGITAANVTVGAFGNGPTLFDRTVKDLERWEMRLARHSEHLLKVRSVPDIEAAKASRRLGIIYGFQDAAMLEGQVERLTQFRNLGVRIIQLTYNTRNELGDGALERDNRGLTEFGRAAVEQMNELGILIDLSHCGARTTADAISVSRRPVAITHAGCAALAQNPRNKTDELLKQLANRGGLVGIYLMPFLRENGQAYAEDVIRHIEHAWNVAGEEHVGIGTDGFIGAVDLTPEYRQRLKEELNRRRAAGISAPGETEDVVPLIPDLNEPRRLERLGSLLHQRGHSAGRIEKLLGANFLRVAREAWRV